MTFIRPKKFVVAITLSLAILIFLTTTMIWFGDEEKITYSITYDQAGGAQSSDAKIFKSLWNFKQTDPTLRSLHRVRSQDYLNFSITNSKLPVSNINSNMFYLFESQDFSRCRMSNCFDYSRCHYEGPLKVHIVPKRQTTTSKLITSSGESNVIHENILRIIRESKYFEPNSDKACIFVLEDDTLDRDPLSQSFRSNLTNLFTSSQRYGMNHLIFNLYSGSWPDYKVNDFAGLHFGAAILAKASSSIHTHRPGFDISLPLFSYLHPQSESTFDLKKGFQENRSLFLTFKGKRYVFGEGSDTRNNLYHLNNKIDTLMLTTCRHGKKWRELSDARCLVDEKDYNKHDFIRLMEESIFCLTPRGRRLGSFRYLEALSYGCIPVILSDRWVKPFDDILDWSHASVQFPEKLLLQVPDMLRDFSSNMTKKMRQNCLYLYDEYFSTMKKIVISTLSIVERRIKNQIHGY